MIRFKFVFAICISLFIVCSNAQSFAGTKNSDKKKKAPAITDQNQKISYSLGYNIGKNLQKDFKIDMDTFFKGFKDSHTRKMLLTEEEMKQSIMLFKQQVREKQIKKIKSLAEKNKAEGAAFLKKNKTRKGVITLKSGLQYKIIKKGTGASPLPTSTVKCNYRGTTIDGKEFDSSYKRGKPAEFKVNGVIKGWTEALQLMKVGSEWKLFVPSKLAYGDNGAGRVIEPGKTLIFDVELLGIK